MEEKSSRSAEEDKLMEDSKIFSDEEQFLNATDMESDDMMDGKGKGRDISVSMSLDMTTDLVKGSDVNEETLSTFCREASQAFFDEFGLISHQLNSYNELVTNGIQRLFDSLGEITVQPGYGLSKKGSESSDGWRRATITYGKVTLEPPTFWTANGDECLKLMPKHARLQKMTYSSQMKVEINVQIYKPGFVKSDKYKTGKEKYADKSVLGEVKTEIVMGRIPVMVGSKLCWLRKLDKSDCLYDSGGYFLIKGMEKAFVAQETRCLNRIWVSDKPAWMVTYYSEPAAKRKRIYVKLAEATKKEGFSGEKIINVSFLYAPVPIWVMFFALGASSDKEVFQMIDLDSCDAGLANILLATINDADENYEGFRNRGKALEHVNGLIKNVKYPPSESIEECISHYLFPSIDEHKQKALFLGYMVKCLLLACSGRRACDNRDDFRNKRLDLAGELLAQELWINIRHAERRMVRAMQRDLDSDRDLQLIERYLDASIITNGLMRAFSTGLWSHPYIRTQRCPGVVATLRRTNPLQMMSDLRKTRQQVLYGRKRGDERYPNPSYWGKVCFLSTPDGENCGLVKNLAVTGLVSTKLMEPLLDKLISCGMEELDADNMWSLSGMDKVFLNGDWVGVCQNPSSFVMKLRSMRRTRLINLQVEIKWDKKQREIRIFSDAGRILRPLLIVENLEKIKKFKRVGYSFESLLNEQIVELIGTEEEEDCQTAWGIKYLFKTDWQASPKYTHCELDISFLLGLSCGIIPFANHNFARRVLYQSEKQSQQAIGFSTTNPNIRVDTLSHQLYYPQKPLFRTMISDCIGKRDYKEGKYYMAKPEIFNGQNAIVAVNVHQGYNQEDSLVINRASLERGMFRTEHFRSYKAEVDNREVVSTKYLKLKEKVDFGKGQSTFGRADSLDDDGFPYVGASLQSGDVVIGKLTESKDSKIDQCLKLKHTERGMVQKVVLSSNDEGKNFGVVTLRQVRSPCLGDKFSSMHGQKGVVGFLESQENFPFTLQGIVPDIVINPHSFPTRQTPGQLLESALGKGIACGGSMRYATPFSTASVEVITEQLHRAGYSKGGDEKVCSGRTGEMIPCMIFMGPTFYQRLIHMAEDKVKFRNTGPVHPLTRQPVADRKRFGGVKFGEMERDCLLAHGAAANLHERLFLLSDFSQMHICQTCSRFANVIQRPAIDSSGKKFRGPYCQSCQSSENLVKVNVPYGAKLLYQELFSMGICLKFETEIC